MRRSIRSANNAGRKHNLKALTIATIAGLSIIGLGAQATTIDEVDLSQKALDKPTLDYLHENNVQMTDENGTETGVYPQSAYTLTKVEANPDGTKPAGDNIITKFEYDKTTGALTPVYYSLDLKQTEYGNKNATNQEVKYYSWSKDSDGNNTLIEGTESSHDITYYVDKDRLSERITNKSNGIDISKDFVGNDYFFTEPYQSSLGGITRLDGAICNSSSSTINNITGDFIGNKFSLSYSSYVRNIGSGGGAIGNWGSIGNITGNFIGNEAYTIYNNAYQVEALGGAISNWGSIGNITGNFIGNYTSSTNSTDSSPNYKSYSSGGAIYNYKDGTIDNITGNFIGNYATATVTTKYNYATAVGGAIGNRGTIENIIGDFIGNYASATSSTSTTNSAYGGAIYNSSIIGDITGDFIGNYASSSSSSPSSFYSQTSSSYGGAIYNKSTIGNITGDFIGNYASASNISYAYGGAICNSSIIGDITGDFIGNYASASSSISYAYGGAIYNKGTIGDITGSFIGNYAKSKTVNALGGAIYNGTSSTIGNITGDFIGNYAYSGGAIYNSDNGTISNITGSFIGNYAKSKTVNALGGAIYNGTSSTIGNITGDFIGNYAYSGGAIYNSDNGTISNITGSFINNSGKAIYNNSSIGNITGDFINNITEGYGGAIYNDSKGIIAEITGNFIGNNANDYGGAIYNEGSIGNITGNFIDNYTGHYSGAIHNKGTIGDITGNFVGNHVQKSDSYTFNGAITNFGTIGNITGNFIGNYADSSRSSGGAIYNDSAKTIGNITGNFIGNYANSSGSYPDGESYAYGGAIKNSYRATIGDISGDFIGNYAKSENGEAKGGAIYSSADLNFVADNRTNTFKDNYTESDGVKDDNAIYVANNATMNFTMKNNGKFYMADNIDGTVTKDSDGNITNTYSVNIKGDDINNTTFYMLNDIRNANVTFDNTTINTINNQVHVYNFNTLTVNSDTNFVADVDLANEQMDRFTANSYGSHNGNKLNVVGMNLLSDSTKDVTEIFFAEQGLKNNVVNGMPKTGEYNLPSTAQTTFYTPIYKYNAIYDNRDDGGYFVFDRISAGNNSGNPSDNFNPAVLAPSVASQAGANATMNQTFNYAFQNSDNFMAIPYLERVSMKNANRYALSPTGDATDVGTFSSLYPMNETSSAWVKPYASFENIPLKNGPKVSNITYGTLVGFDTPLKSIKHGWDRTWTGYIGYNGASQRYSGVDATQNGGLLGGTLTLYKGNFFNATTVSTGAIVGDARTMYGTDNYTMLMAGVGNKTGYNFEFKEGKLIIQPSMLLSYTFVNTFDYTNAAGVRMKNDPLHAIQIAPGVKFIANTKNGWQPYIGVNMVWNLLDKSKVSANDVRLPEMSIKPYIQYGVGIQKRFKDRYMAFGQAMIQNGGRNGISLTAGFRWALGKEGKPLEKVQGVNNKTVGYSGASRVGAVKTGEIKSVRTGAVAQAQPERKIIKQMSQSQRETIAKQYQNTTRTTTIGTLKQL